MYTCMPCVLAVSLQTEHTTHAHRCSMCWLCLSVVHKEACVRNQDLRATLDIDRIARTCVPLFFESQWGGLPVLYHPIMVELHLEQKLRV